MKTGYQTDLAYIHDAGFSGFVREAAPWLLRTLRRNGIGGGLVVDLGCGSGRWAAELLRAGYRVEGVDLSPAMIALARKNAPGAKLRVASLLNARFPRCAAATAIGECVNYAFDRSNSAAVLKKFFRRVHDALQPGGVFIFDAAEPGLAPDRPVRRWMQGDDWAILLELTGRRDGAMRQMTVFRRVNRCWRRSEEAHPLRLYRREALQRMLQNAGFEIEVVGGYGSTRFRSSLAGFVCRKSDENET